MATLSFNNQAHRNILRQVLQTSEELFSKGMGGNNLEGTSIGQTFNVLLTGRFILDKYEDRKTVRVECTVTVNGEKRTWNVRPTKEVAKLLSSDNADDIAKATSTPFSVKRSQLKADDGAIIDFVAFERTSSNDTDANPVDIATKFGIQLTADQAMATA